MSFSQSAASGLVPLLARVILAAVFVPAGYNKVMNVAEFTGDDARRLRELAIVEDHAEPKPAAYVVAPVADQSKPDAASAPPSKPTTDEVGAGGAAPTAPQGNVAPVKARELHRVTLLVDKNGWRYPVAQAWLAALTELVGGVLLLVGLGSRVWALGLAIAMAVAFYLTSMGAYADTSGFFRAFPIDAYNRFAAQAALFALAFGIVLSGAGAASLDRIVAGSKGGAKPSKKAADG
ncbi:MAG: DoxX family membrane protein [Phycisphaerae bacterium]|nr:DoxX family membrane protein [Phycisphaerae bacterium]